MAGKKGGEGSKKAAGQSRKAEAAAAKAAAEDAKKAAAEDVEWKKGAKDSSKKYVPCFITLDHLDSEPRNELSRAVKDQLACLPTTTFHV